MYHKIQAFDLYNYVKIHEAHKVRFFFEMEVTANPYRVGQGSQRQSAKEGLKIATTVHNLQQCTMPDCFTIMAVVWDATIPLRHNFFRLFFHGGSHAGRAKQSPWTRISQLRNDNWFAQDGLALKRSIGRRKVICQALVVALPNLNWPPRRDKTLKCIADDGWIVRGRASPCWCWRFSFNVKNPGETTKISKTLYILRDQSSIHKVCSLLSADRFVNPFGTLGLQKT